METVGEEQPFVMPTMKTQNTKVCSRGSKVADKLRTNNATVNLDIKGTNCNNKLPPAQ